MINGGDGRNRTDDPLLAKQVLYQLSYIPDVVVLHSKTATGQLNKAQSHRQLLTANCQLIVAPVRLCCCATSARQPSLCDLRLAEP
jgi:hypothetical protein